MTNKEIFDMLTGVGMTDEGACGLMGNLMAESGMRSTNVEDRSGLDDETYTEQVDAGQREDFATDSYGYGLAQWTAASRKLALLDYARKSGRSIGDAQMQIQFCIRELNADFTMLMLKLCTSHDIDECADRVCDQYEKPQINNYPERRKYAREFYNEFRGSGALAEEHQTLYPAEQTAEAAQATAPASFFDIKIAQIQLDMWADGYWDQPPDGLKSIAFFDSLDQYSADMRADFMRYAAL